MLFILIIALLLRWQGINWDIGWHLHPDERMLIMVADRIQLFSQMNPDFFNYGSLPLYILRGTAQLLTPVPSYDNMLSIGRSISILLDLCTLILVYRITLLLWKNKYAAYFASFLYALAFFPIQNTHFFIVDNFLNFFMTGIVYVLLVYMQKPKFIFVFILSIFAAAAMTTKATGVILLAPIVAVSALPIHKQTKTKYFLQTFFKVIFFAIYTFIFAYIFMPYAFDLQMQPVTILNERFLSDVKQQLQMNSDPFIFPYTLQYVGTVPYLYYLKNIVIWGLGPFISIMSIIGIVSLVIPSIAQRSRGIFHNGLRKHIIGRNKNSSAVVKRFLDSLRSLGMTLKLPATGCQLRAFFVLYYVFYFLLIGRSAVKFMRYMLPLYPFACILAGYGLYFLLMHSKSWMYKFITLKETKETKSAPKTDTQKWKMLLGFVLLTGSIIWTLMFVGIYSKKHTRIAASEWVYTNIPSGSTIAIEHWDDRLPLPIGPNNYNFAELTLYDPDSPEKWIRVNEVLEQSDYMIIASNRLYTPLMKLTDCTVLPPHRCYPLTDQYYKDLFAGKRGFTKVAEFNSYPKLEFGSWKLEIPDDTADESFTVYDHPKIIIFKKNDDS